MSVAMDLRLARRQRADIRQPVSVTFDNRDGWVIQH
jgi:hypothetical protein